MRSFLELKIRELAPQSTGPGATLANGLKKRPLFTRNDIARRLKEARSACGTALGPAGLLFEACSSFTGSDTPVEVSDDHDISLFI